MFDYVTSILAFLIPICISIIALTISLYREFAGPDISLLGKPLFKLTDESFDVSDGRISNWLNLSEVSLVFANYGRKGGSILDFRLDFTPNEMFKEFFRSFHIDPSIYYSTSPQLPITIEDGENCILKFKPSIRTIDWKKFALNKTLRNASDLGESVDKAIFEGMSKFDLFLAFLNKNEKLGEISCTVSLTVGRFRTQIKNSSKK